MVKVLISALGVGGYFDKEKGNREREYRTTTYILDDKSYPEEKFVASVLYKHFNIDKIILIGTTKSMWEAVYDSFCDLGSIKKDDKYWYELAEKIDQCNYSSNIDHLELSKVEAVLGNDSKCLLIKYGVDEKEIWENFARIINIIQELKHGDELYIDITHSFRSLAMLQFFSIAFIQDLLIQKSLKINGIYYGMLDVARKNELGYAPIINLVSFFKMINWMQGSHSLQFRGDAYKISECLEESHTDLAKSLSQLSDSLNINYISDIIRNASTLQNNLNKTEDFIPFQFISHIPNSFVKKLAKKTSDTESDYQINLARWYFQKKRFAEGYITLAESIITYVCEYLNYETKDFEKREQAKSVIKIGNQFGNTQLAKLYFTKINPTRNAIAHASFDKRRPSMKEAINNALSYCDQLQQIFNSGVIQ